MHTENRNYSIPFDWQDRIDQETEASFAEHFRHGFQTEEEYRLHRAVQGRLNVIAHEDLGQARRLREMLLERERLLILTADPYHDVKYGTKFPSAYAQSRVDALNQQLADFDVSMKATYLQLAEQGF